MTRLSSDPVQMVWRLPLPSHGRGFRCWSWGAANGSVRKAGRVRKKTNVHGSAIAIGHPNTASGARIIMNLVYELRRMGGGYAMGAICGGLAQADACILKV